MSARSGGVLTCTLVRKRCACGKQVKAIQLTRYGACDACLKARTAAEAVAASEKSRTAA